MPADGSYQFEVDGMTCASCVMRVERLLNALPGVAGAEVNLARESARVPAATNAADVSRVLSAAGYPPGQQEIALSIEAMTCASCVARVEKALLAVPGVVSARVNLASETAQVTVLAGAVRWQDLAAASAAFGYPAHPRRAATESQDRKAVEAQVLQRQVILAAVLTLPVFVVEMGGHLIPRFHHWLIGVLPLQQLWLMEFVLTTLVLTGPGLVFFRRGIPALLKAAPDMNALVALGTGAAYLFSCVAVFAPQLLPAASRTVYFEAASVIVVLILLGRLLEARAKGRTGAAISRLIGLQPRVARVERGGAVLDLAVDQVVAGDLLLLRPGERVAVDGEVVEGSSPVDESMLTGEPMPVVKSPGAAVTGGTMNGAGSLKFRATRVGAETTLAQIIRMVEVAQSARLPVQDMVNRVTAWFVPVVLVLALVTVVIWLVAGPSSALGPALGPALVAGVSVLIIACPCAMGLAVPTSIVVGSGRAAELGVLFRKGQALQELSGVAVVAFDKTGTLTRGTPEMTDLLAVAGADADQVLTAVAALESRSEHPIGQALLRAAAAKRLVLPQVAAFAALPGLGISGVIGGRRWLVGADRLLAGEGIDLAALAEQGAALAQKGRSPLYAACDGQAVAVLAVADQLRPTTRAALAALQARGLKLAMITGDNARTAAVVAADLGLDHFEAEVLPGGKVLALDRLRQGGAKVAFVGDGINDAPALAAAEVGLAVGTGTDVAVESADVVLMSGDLLGVVHAFDLSRATMRNIRQNLVWAFGYNALLIPVAAGVLYPLNGTLLSPMLAAAAMAASSVLVVGNALRLRFVGAVLG